MNAVESRRQARCANLEHQSDALPPPKPERGPEGQKAATVKLVNWAASFVHPDPERRPTSGFYLYGPTGTGKTFQAALTVQRLRNLGIPVLFLKTKTALNHLKDFDTPGEVERWRERLANADILVLDDLGAHQSKPYVIEELVAVFDHRHDFEMPTLITSNLDGPALFRELGDRLADRVTGMCEAIAVTGESLR